MENLIGIIGALHLLALAIVNVTPTPKDNEVYGRIYKLVEKLAGILTTKVKQ